MDMTRLICDISMSLDGFVAGPNQTLEEPLGERGERLHEWGFRLRRSVNELELDHNFQGWGGTARIDWPDEGASLVIEADREKLVGLTARNQARVANFPGRLQKNFPYSLQPDAVLR